MTPPDRTTVAGRAYLDLRNLARADRRPIDELFQLYALEGFLARLVSSPFAARFVLKGGVLLAAFGERRPTRDIDLQGHALDNDAESVRLVMREIAGIELDDGLVFDVDTARADVIRDEEAYTGVRVTMTAQLATARQHVNVDVNVGDPIIPSPQVVSVPRLLGGEVVVRGYPLAMVYAEKIVTAVTRGTVNTRWRDFGDIYLLARHHAVNGTDLVSAVHGVAQHRGVELLPLAQVLKGYGDIGQQRWAAWRRKQRLDERLPEQFGEIVAAVIEFAEPAVAGAADGMSWDPRSGRWS